MKYNLITYYKNTFINDHIFIANYKFFYYNFCIILRLNIVILIKIICKDKFKKK